MRGKKTILCENAVTANMDIKRCFPSFFFTVLPFALCIYCVVLLKGNAVGGVTLSNSRLTSVLYVLYM